jgi:hypothetical protein
VQIFNNHTDKADENEPPYRKFLDKIRRTASASISYAKGHQDMLPWQGPQL